MRTVKFRGYSTTLKENEFFYGDLVQYHKDEMYIMEQNYRNWDVLYSGFRIDPKSVGQFTGLCDIQGKEIYEGDIVANTYDFDDTQYVVRYCDGDFVICEILNGDIEEALSRDIYESPDRDKIYSIGTFCEGWRGENYLQVVGNVYENKLKKN